MPEKTAPTAALFTSSKDIYGSPGPEKRFTSLFNHMHEGVFVSTPEGKILDCNDAFVRMLGYSGKEEVLKLDVAQSLYVDMEDHKKFLGEIARQGYVRNFEYRLRCKDGREITCDRKQLCHARSRRQS